MESGHQLEQLAVLLLGDEIDHRRCPGKLRALFERGEAHGRCVFSLSALKIAKPDWLRDKKINVLVLTALEKSAEFPGAPAVVDLVAKQEDRQLLELPIIV